MASSVTKKSSGGRASSRGGAQLRSKAVGWLTSSEVVAAQSEIHLSSWAGRDAEDVAEEVKRVGRTELPFIDNDSFRAADAGDHIFAEPLSLVRNETGSKSSGLPTHLDRLCTAGLLTPEQERSLFERMNYCLWAANEIRADLRTSEETWEELDRYHQLVALATWHRDRIVEANLRLVFSIIKSFVNPYVTFDDLLGDGMLALIRAVEKFDYARGFRFSTYATQVVRRNSYRLVVDKQTDRSRVASGIEDMDFDESDSMRESSMTEHRWHQLRARMNDLLNRLDRREKMIIRARFSLGSHRKVHTLQSIADRLGVSKERVRQIEKRALEKLQQMAGTELADSV